MKILEVHSDLPITTPFNEIECENSAHRIMLDPLHLLETKFPVLSVNYCSFFSDFYLKFGMLKVFPTYATHIDDFQIPEDFLIFTYRYHDTGIRKDVYQPVFFKTLERRLDIYCLARPPEQS